MKRADCRSDICRLRLPADGFRGGRQQPGLQLRLAEGQDSPEAPMLLGARAGKMRVRVTADEEIQLLGAPMPGSPNGAPAADLDVLAHNVSRQITDHLTRPAQSPPIENPVRRRIRERAGFRVSRTTN